MSIIYACVCRGTSRQAEGGVKDHLKNTLDAFIEGTVDSPNEKGSFLHGPYSYNFLTDRGFTMIAIARKEISVAIVFCFLKDLQEIFNAGTVKSKFTKQINDLIVRYKDPVEADKIRRIADQLEEVKGIMKDNLKNMVMRAEQLAQLDESVVALEESAGVFKDKAKDVHEVVWWNDLRCKIIFGSVITVIIVLVIVVLSCGGFEFPNCKAN